MKIRVDSIESDFEKHCKVSVASQMLASMQPRTSPRNLIVCFVVQPCFSECDEHMAYSNAKSYYLALTVPEVPSPHLPGRLSKLQHRLCSVVLNGGNYDSRVAPKTLLHGTVFEYPSAFTEPLHCCAELPRLHRSSRSGRAHNRFCIFIVSVVFHSFHSNKTVN